MKKFFVGFVIFLLLFAVLGFADETNKVTPLSATDSAKSSQQTQDNTSKEEPAPGPSITVPPFIPPGTPFTPEQIKGFFSKPKEENYIILNFDNANLRDVINTISSITGENFILSPGLEARITIHSAGRIPRSEVLSVFESILEVNNMALVKSGRFYKIVSGPTTKQKPIEVRKGKKAELVPYGDRPITQVIPVEYVPVGELSSLLQPMLSSFGSLIPNPRNNLLIVNDIASNIKRFLMVLKEVDVNAFQNTRMGFFQPKYSDVKTLAEELTEIINALNLGREGTVVMVPIERINSLIVFSSSPSLLKTVEGWFKKLDEEITADQKIFVYPVQNVEAESIADILKAIYKEDAAETKRTIPPRTPSKPKKRAQRLQVPASVRPEFRIEIVTFEPTNSLVILAPPGMYREITEIIKKLDVYPKEVLIEVVIAEATLEDTDQLGIQWSLLHGVHIEGDTGFTEHIQARSSEAPSYSLPPTLGGTTEATGLSYLLYKPDRLVAMLHALASRGKVNILSSPRLLVRDQEEATIEVGSEIPTSTSTTQTADTTTTSTLTQNIEYKTVGIKLKIKPTINDERTVVLDIEQEVSDQLTNVTVGQEGYSYPAFSTRKTQTSVVVPDKQGIVIAGIMKERKGKSYQGIPILSSIPILGYLFRYTVNTTTKTELIVVLTPHVITNRTEADVLTMEFMEKLKEVKDFLKERENKINIPTPEEINTTQTNEQ